MKKSTTAAIALILALTLGLASRANALGTITTSPNVLSVNLLGGPVSRMMISYGKTYGASTENVLLDIYGTFSITYNENGMVTTHNLTDQLRLMVDMTGDELQRFKDCTQLLSINQAKRELAAKLSPPATIPLWAQLQFHVERGSAADSMIRSWAFSNLAAPGAVLPINSVTSIFFVTCTTNL